MLKLNSLEKLNLLVKLNPLEKLNLLVKLNSLRPTARPPERMILLRRGGEGDR